MDIGKYLDEVRKQYDSGHATEHSYRPALKLLFDSIDPALTVINEPKKSEGGMPDFLFSRGDVPFGWAEAKDIDRDVIRLKGYSKEQRRRYEKAYPNLIYTNGVDFEFIREGTSVHFVSIADFLMGLQPNSDRFEELERQLRLFAEAKPISIRSAARLAEMMAAKAAIIKDEVGIALGEDADFRSALGGQYKSFKANLLPALEPDEFADIYAETITYGMFAARFHDTDLNTFSRQEALEKLPASNPFLKGLFDYIAGPALPRRLKYIVDDLVQVMRASDPHSLFKDYGKWDARNDPFVHFYEDFLAAYNPKKRRSRGVWYTPEPVVDFIVRAVDDVLKTEFGLADGLADTSKVTVDWDTGTNHPKTGKPITSKRDVHKVQILDPATGTGTFLAKAVQLISDRVKARAPGKWSAYVEEDLLPRLHGFELLMASYAMCHMKLDMMLGQTGYKPSEKPPRLSVWLTNALEPAEREVKDLFFQPLAEEARGASEVKRQTPIMCVIGNPPYSSSSQNTGAWITDLIEDYKYTSGVHFREIKHWLHDDYVKFLRMAEEAICRTGTGVVAMITNHGFLENPTFRGMRYHLLETFDRIHVLDLHGNTTKGEHPPDGVQDTNVFDIQQGVSIAIFTKISNKAAKRKRGANNGISPAKLFHAELWGSRTAKSEALFQRAIGDRTWNELQPREPYYFFVPKNLSLESVYNRGFPITALMGERVTGVITARDGLAVDFDRQAELSKLHRFVDPARSDTDVRMEFFGTRSVPNAGDTRGWDMVRARRQLAKLDLHSVVRPVDYRLFDRRAMAYTPLLVDWGREAFMRHMIERPNLALVTCRQGVGAGWANAFLSDTVGDDSYLSNRSRERGYYFPLYLVSAANDLLTGASQTNLDPRLYTAICKDAGIDPADQAGPDDDFRSLTGDARPSEVKLFDYIYGVLHSPAYRETFAEFLKIDFPRIPYPPSPKVFAHVSEKGEQLRRLHLMETRAIGETPYPYRGEGDDVVSSGFPKWEANPSSVRHEPVEGPSFPSAAATEKGQGFDRLSANGKVGRVHVNKDQYFDGVPEIAWTFHIGGYQPAQKWLKDRRGRTLSFDDITHYQRIVKILTGTDRIMHEIELPLDGVETG